MNSEQVALTEKCNINIAVPPTAHTFYQYANLVVYLLSSLPFFSRPTGNAGGTSTAACAYMPITCLLACSPTETSTGTHGRPTHELGKDIIFLPYKGRSSVLFFFSSHCWLSWVSVLNRELHKKFVRLTGTILRVSGARAITRRRCSNGRGAPIRACVGP